MALGSNDLSTLPLRLVFMSKVLMEGSFHHLNVETLYLKIRLEIPYCYYYF